MKTPTPLVPTLAPTWGPLYWTIFLVVASAFFFAPEFYALFTNWNNTFSDFVWIELKVQRNQNPWNWSGTTFLIFGVWMLTWIWLTFHFFFRRFT